MSMVRTKLILIFLSVALCIIISGGNALADGFAEKLVQIDGISSEGRLDNENNLEFLGLALWNEGIKLKFSPSVRARCALKPSVRTAGKTGFWGNYRVDFFLAPKTPNANKNNLQVKVLDNRGTPIPDIGVMVTPGGSAWAVEVTWSKEDARGVFEVFVSYAEEMQKPY
jgi:hypothetical protein